MQEETGRYCLLPTFIPSQFSMSHHMGLSTFSVPSLWEKYTEKVFFFFFASCVFQVTNTITTLTS